MNFFWSHTNKITEQTYGIVYNKYAAINPLIAPSGWHVATNQEWNDLGIAYNGDYWEGSYTENIDNVSHKLKSTDGSWFNQVITPQPTNESGMNIYPSGIIFGDGTKGGRDEFANFWTSDPPYSSPLGPFNDVGAYKNIGFTNNRIYRVVYVYSLTHGFSLRLVKDSAVGWVEGTKLTDIDGNNYSAKLMADEKVWLTENYQVNKLRDGTPIPFLINKDDWANATYPAFTHYNLIQ